MNKTRTFSIYLLKEQYNAESALRGNHGLETIPDASNLPAGASLYILDNQPTPPWWKSYFGITRDLHQSLKAAIVFLPVEARTFSITFGNIRHKLVDTSYEYDFGLRVALNCLDRKKLKSTDILDPSGAKRQRTQLPIDSDLRFFGFESDTNILKSLTGKVQNCYEDFFKHATGANNIRISSDVTYDRLPQLCRTLLERYQDDEYRETFPGIQNISPIRDPATIKLLNEKLIEGFRGRHDALSLNVPEILNYQDGLWVKFKGAGRSEVYDDVYLGEYYDYLESQNLALGNIEVPELKKHYLVLTNEQGEPRGENHNIYKCLIYDTVLDNEDDSYHLCDGNWYRVDRSFISNLSEFLNPKCRDTNFLNFDHKNEADFNLDVSQNGNYVCLDGTNIAPDGQTRVEPCDIFELRDGKAILHHIKISTRSSSLSHLFNQGINSIHLIRDEESARAKLTSLIQTKVEATVAPDFINPISSNEFQVEFGIITNKEPARRSLNFPLFSRISLMRAMKDLNRMGIKAHYCFIMDDTNQ